MIAMGVGKLIMRKVMKITPAVGMIAIQGVMGMAAVEMEGFHLLCGRIHSAVGNSIEAQKGASIQGGHRGS